MILHIDGTFYNNDIVTLFVFLQSLLNKKLRQPLLSNIGDKAMVCSNNNIKVFIQLFIF